MSRSCFDPTIVEVSPGTTVTWTNDDPYPHMVTGANQRWGSTDLIAAGGSISETFDEPGVYPYTCMLHAGMTGAVVVGAPDAAGAGSMTSDGGTTGTVTETASAAAAETTAATGTDPVALAVTAVVALLVGFVLGWIALARFSRRRSTFAPAEERPTVIGLSE